MRKQAGYGSFVPGLALGPNGMDVAPALPSAGTHVELCPALDEGVDADRGSAAEAFSNGGQDQEQVGQHAGDICAAGEAHAGIASDLHCRSSCDDSVPPSRTGSR